MSRGAPPTQPISAVTPGTTQSIAAAAQSGQQRQATNNAAMAARNAEALRRQQIESQEFLTQETLNNRMNMGLLQSANYARKNATDMQMQQNILADRQSARNEQARQFNESKQMKEKVHQDTMNMAKANQMLKLDMALADEYQDPDALARLQEAEDGLIERTLQMEAAKRIQQGQEVDMNKLRTQVARQIRDMQKAQAPLIDRAMDAVSDDVILPMATMGYFGETQGLSKANRFLSDALETVVEVSTAGFFDTAGFLDESKLEVLLDPDQLRSFQSIYFSQSIGKALAAAFPKSDSRYLTSSINTVLSNATINNSEETAQRLQEVFRQNNIDPGVAGEIISRMQEGINAQRQTFRGKGVTANMGRNDITEDNVLDLANLKLISSSALRAAFSHLPSMKAYDAWAGGVTGSKDEVQETLRQMVEEGVEVGDVERLVEMIEGLESGAEGLGDMEREMALEQGRVTRLGDTIADRERREVFSRRQGARDTYAQALEDIVGGENP
jgi:hypothetical protein